MMMRIRQRAKQNRFARRAVLKLRVFTQYRFPSLAFRTGRWFRKRGVAMPPFYRNILQYRDKHKGGRCFIVATGPSLTVSDLKLIENEVTFAMNSLCRIAEKSDWLPTYYGIQDKFVYGRMRGDVQAFLDKAVSFVSSDIYRRPGVRRHRPVVFPLNRKDHWINTEDRDIGFSADAFVEVADGYTITYSILQLAVYMGFSEIYLLGADCDYSKEDKKHFIEHGVNSPTESTAYERLTRTYEACRRYAQQAGNVTVYNATRGGKLEVFPRIDLDTLFPGGAAVKNAEKARQPERQDT